MIAVSEARFHVVEMETRVPFHFGGVAVTEIPKVFLCLEATVDGTSQRGMSMGGLIPGWFYKEPEMDVETGYRNMVAVFRAAADAAQQLDAEPTPFEFWRALYDRQREWAADTDYPPLLWIYGVSLVEQALVDAFCRSEGISFDEAVRQNRFGIDLGSVYKDLAPYEPADLLPAEPLHTTTVRHTVGLGDPLTEEELTTDRPDDSLPLTLEEYVREDGVDHFKIKLSADRERDADRLARIGGLLSDLGVDDYRCTVDANEGYDSVTDFRRQWEAHTSDPALADLFDSLAYVEQPLPRDAAFTPETEAVFSSWDDAPPVIIDESDDEIGSTGTALAYGYAGTSHKNCKGVFKGIINACLLADRDRTDNGREYVFSAEDLTTVGPIELLQDLAVVATIGADHVERNGHHYFYSLRAFSQSVRDSVLADHSDLYRRHDDGVPTVAIDDGTIGLDTVVNAPFGAAVRPDLSELPRLDDWLDRDG